MNEIELKATRSFSHVLGNFTRGRRYKLDADDLAVKGLVDGGYFVPTTEPEVPRAVDLAGIDEFLASGVGTRRTRPKKSKAGEPEAGVGDGTGEAQPDTD